MGEVYRADDTKLKRSVALKRMSPKLRTDEHYRQRFLKEAERASCLSDQRVAGIYDVLEENGETFLVMEYVEGSTLRSRLTQPFSLEEFLPVAIQCAEALVAAHEKGVVHRDIKPENIMLTPKGQVKILDFGVAKRLARPADADATASTASQPGTLSGTPAYMAPEVLLEKESDARADIFSLGIVFYEMLTAQHPFRADSFLATSDRIRHEVPKPLGHLNPQVPGKLEGLVAKMLAKDPAERYANALRLLADLRALEQGEPRPVTLRAVLRRWVSRRKFVLAVVGAILLLLWIPRPPPWHPPPLPTEPKWVLIADFENRTGDEFFDHTARELLTLAIEQSRFLMVFPRGRIVETLKLMRKPGDTRLDQAIAREICVRENLPMFISGEVIPAAGGYEIAVRAVDAHSEMTLAALGEPLGGKQDLWNAVDRLSAKLREHLGEERSVVKRDSVPLERATTGSLEALERFSRALDLQAKGKVDEALALMKAAVELDPEFAIAHSRMAVSQMALGADEEALASSSRAYALRDRVSERERYQIQANYHRLRLDYEAALEDFRTLAALYPRDPTAHSKLAENYAFAGKLAEAIEAAKRASDLYPKNVLMRGQLIELLAQANRTDDALREVRVARTLGGDNPAIAGGEAFAWLMKGDVPRARQALQAMVNVGGAYYENLGRLYLAQLLTYEGKLTAAAEQLESDLALDLKTGNESYAEIRRYWLARIYLLLGQRKSALAHLDALLAKTRRSPIHLHQLRQAALVYVEIGDVSRGQRVLQQLEQLQSAFPSNFSKAAVAQVRGGLKQAAGEHIDALRDLQQARALWGGVLEAWSLATYWDKRGDYEKALNFYREVLARKGDVMQWDFPGLWALAHLQAARCYRRLGNDKEGARLYDEFLHLWGTEARDLPQVKRAKEELKGLRPT
jgi:tetratricopeptide (TPR) repeat protein